MSKKVKWSVGLFGPKKTSYRKEDRPAAGDFDISLLYDTSALLKVPLKSQIISLRDKNGYTLLHHAADLDCPDALESLLVKKADPNASSPLKVTPVHLAAEKGHLHCLNLLLDFGGDCSYLDNEGNSPIDYAHRNQNLLCEHLLLKHLAEVQEKTDHEMTAIMEQLESLLQKNQPLNEIDGVVCCADFKVNVNNILHREYQLRCPSQLSSLMPAAMAMPSILKCCNLLHVACHAGQLNILKHFLMHHPDMVLSVTQGGFTALHIAIMNNQQEIVEFLLNQLTIIVNQSSPVNSVHTMLSKAISVISLKKACDFVNAQTCLGHTALHFAVIMNHIVILKLLLSLPESLQLNIEAKDKMQFTPLHAATFANALEAIKCLLEYNADPNTQSNLTQYTDVLKTPLAQACAFNYSNICSYLLQNGAVDQDWLAIQWSLRNKCYNECFYHILGAFIRHDESLSEAIKLQRRNEGLSVSKTVGWNGIPLRTLNISWLENALSTLTAFLSKPTNLLLNVTSFSISECSLTVIPLEIFQLTKVVNVDLSSNEISILPTKSEGSESSRSAGWTCTSLEKLNLSKNKLIQVPNCVFQLPNLTYLDVSFNYISNISINLWTAPKLSEFLCSHNKLTTMPSRWVDYLHCRTKSVLETNKLLQLSKTQSLKEIVQSDSCAEINSVDDDSTLSLSLMKLSDDTDPLDNDDMDMASSMLQAALQERLIITGSGGVTIDWNKEITANAKAGFLVQLDFSHNQLASLPLDLPCLAPKLNHLNVSHNDLTSVCIPRGFPADLKYLYLSHNPLHFIDCEKETIISMACSNPNAKVSRRNRNALCMHRSHNQLVNLQVLDISYCNLYSLNLFMPSRSQKRLSEKLKDHLKGSSMKQSESIPLVTAVVSQLASLDNIEVLAKLTVPLATRLVIKHNNLQCIPESICSMLNLGSLEINHNPITELCKELGCLKKLWFLPLEGLSLKFPPHSILTQGKTTDIIGFLRSLLQNSLPYHHVKLLLVGWSGRGKTSLLKKLTEKGQTSMISGWHGHSQKYKDKNVPIIRNWTCSMSSKVRSQSKIKKITFKTWDFPSLDDSYSAIYQYFLSQRSLYLVVWNVSHGGAGVQELKSWLLNIEARAPSSPVIVVGTHSDMMTSVKQQAELSENLKMITKLYGDLDNRIDGYPHIMASMVVSSITGAEIKSLRDKVLTVVTELKGTSSTHSKGNNNSFNSQLLINQLIPTSYIQLEDIICDVAQECNKHQKPPVLTYQEFREEIFKHQNLSISKDVNDKELEQAIRFLHDNGTLVHYEDSLLNNLYFIDPQWLCDLLVYIMTFLHRNSLSSDGVVLLKDFSQIFHSDDLPIQWQKEYLYLLTKFDLAVQLDHERLLIPSLLPISLPKSQNPDIPKEVVCLPPIHYFFIMSFVPVGFWPRLMSVLFADTSIELLAKQYCSVHTENKDVFPIASWKKSQCGLEFQYDNLVLLRLVEVKDYYLADPDITSVTIIDDGKFHKKPNSEFHGIVLEVMDVYPIIKYFEHNIGLASSEKKTDSIKFNEQKSRLVRAKPVKKVRKAKQVNIKLVDQEPKNNGTVSSSESGTINDHAMNANEVFDLIKNQNFNLTSGNNLLRALDLAVISRPQVHNKISLAARALLLDTSYENIYAYRLYENTTLQPNKTCEPQINKMKTAHRKPLDSMGKLKPEDSHDKMRAGLISKITEHMFILMNEWFPGIRSHKILIPCPYCLTCRKHTKPNEPIHLKRYFATSKSLTCAIKGGFDEDTTNAFIFSFNDCMCASYDSNVIYCPAHGDIPLEYFVPDVFFANLGKNVITHCNEITVQEMLGEGSFAQVFKVNLRKERIPGCVVKCTAAMKSFSKSLNKEFKQEEGINDVTLDILVSNSKEDFSLASGIDTLRLMHSEVSVISQLNHENIISLLGVVISPPSILLEYAPAGSLSDICVNYWENSQRLLPAVSRATILQIASGIEYLHMRSIIFRDLKCENVLAWTFPLPNSTSSNQSVHVKLSDYGISQFASISGAVGLAGTPGFIAPEILKYRGKEIYTNKVDIFSLGMVIYELTTLRCPFDDMSTLQVNQAIESGIRPSLCQKDLDSPILQRELMNWCWQQDPELRPTASEAVEVVNSKEFCCLVDGVCINDYGKVLCIYHHNVHIASDQKEREASLSLNNGTEKPLDLVATSHSENHEYSKQEIWMSSSNNIQSSTVTVLDYCGKFTAVEDLKIGNSPILSICIVNHVVWMGSEDGYIHFYDARSRHPLAQSCVDYQCPILGILHDQKTKLVYILLEPGIVYIVNDDISMELSSGVMNSVLIKLNIIGMYQVKNNRTSCFAIVPNTVSVCELWIGKNNSITVLNANNLKFVCKLKVSEEVSSCIAHIAVSTVERNREPCNGGVATVNSVFTAFYQGQIITQWDVRTKEIVDFLNMDDFVKDADCTISSIHVTNAVLFIGMQSGMILMIDILASSLVFKLHCHGGRVKPLFTLSVNTDNLSIGQNLQGKAKCQLLSCGSGFKSFIKVPRSCKKSLLKIPSLLLVWNIDQLY